MRARGLETLAITACLLAGEAGAADWDTVPVRPHSEYQAVRPEGTSAYAGGFPIRLRGVVLNNTEDWLNPSPAFTGTYQPWVLGGQAEFFFQAINLDGTPWDPDPGVANSDFGGTAAWIGQNYGNVPWHADAAWNYTDSEWQTELGRLGLQGGQGVTRPIRAGDLVEVRVRVGLHYAGKMNVNEAHDKAPQMDFEVVLLQADYGLPMPVALSLSDLKNADDSAIFDPARAVGGERYQATRVELTNVRLTTESIAQWGSDRDLVVEDGAGRTFDIHLGLDAGFAGPGAPTGLFDVTGILDQASVTGVAGYRLLVMDAADFAAVPEPSAVAVMAVAAVTLMYRRRRTRA